MDWSLIGSATGSVASAIELAKVAIGARDATKIEPELIKLNDALLDAQQRLFTLTSALLVLQQEHVEIAEKLRKADETIAQRGRYKLVEIVSGHWAYRLDATPPKEDEAVRPADAQSTPHVCQPCFDNGRTSVLSIGAYSAHCSVCQRSITLRERTWNLTQGRGRFV